MLIFSMMMSASLFCWYWNIYYKSIWNLDVFDSFHSHGLKKYAKKKLFLSSPVRLQIYVAICKQQSIEIPKSFIELVSINLIHLIQSIWFNDRWITTYVLTQFVTMSSRRFYSAFSAFIRIIFFWWKFDVNAYNFRYNAYIIDLNSTLF